MKCFSLPIWKQYRTPKFPRLLSSDDGVHPPKRHECIRKLIPFSKTCISPTLLISLNCYFLNPSNSTAFKMPSYNIVVFAGDYCGPEVEPFPPQNAHDD